MSFYYIQTKTCTMSEEIIMQQGLRGSFQLMKSLNRSIILNKIRLEGPISRAAIAKDTNLTPPTVSSIVKELIEAGIVIESNQGESSGGRKPTMLIINHKNFYVIGLDIGPVQMRVVMTDLKGNMIEYSKDNLPVPVSNDSLLQLMKEKIQQILTIYKDEHEKFIGIGIGIHGVVDVKNGISLYAPSLKLRNIPIKETLEKEFGMIVSVENDARVMALGESWLGSGNGDSNVVTVNIGRGIGAGIVINGKLFYGEHFIAGEIGHMTIDIGGPICSCGNYGCLEAMAAGPAIANKAIKEISIGKESILRSMVDNNLEKIDGKLVYDAAIQGDPLSIDILKQTGRILGIGLTNLIHIMNPKRIILGGGVTNAEQYIIDNIKETIQNRALTDSAKDTEISLSKLGEYGTAIGAVSLILSTLFTSASTMEN
jgi:N-acetylglucosamine repressor